MTEALRKLLESYSGITPPMKVQTDLSSARSPSYALTQKSEKIIGEDILGQRIYVDAFALHMRRVSATEKDRQGAHEILQKLGEWLTGQRNFSAGDRKITRTEVSPAALQEAYDDGTAVWSMEIRIFCEKI